MKNLPENLPTVGDRIRFLRKNNNMKQVELAVELGIARPTLTRIEKNNDKPSKRIVEEIANLFNVPKDWIIYGRKIIPLNVSLDESDLIKTIRDLDEIDRNFIIDFIKKYVKTKSM